MGKSRAIIPAERIERSVLLIRGYRVMLDADLAELYGVTTKALNQAVKRNAGRFPPDFSFRLTAVERKQVVTNCDHLARLKFSPTRPQAFQLSRFMQWLTMTHTQRWHAHRRSAGRGHLYQSRFKSFPIQADLHFLEVCRYVERNPLRCNLVERAERWRWSSISARSAPSAERPALSDWPVAIPDGWLARVNAPQDEKELTALRLSRDRGQPYGGARWTPKIAARLGLESSLRPVGRPRKGGEA